MKKYSIGVDIGGSHISCAACDLVDRKILMETFSDNEVNNQGTADEIINVWVQTLKDTIRKTGKDKINGIGFAMPGPFDYANGIAWFTHDIKKYENLHGLDVVEAMRKQMNLPQEFPIRFIGDATAFAIGEDWIGKASGTKSSLSITLGTGFGSAFIKNHLPVVNGGEVPRMGNVYHLPFEGSIADDYFSTRGLLNRYKAKTGKQLPGVKQLAELAPNDPIANEIFIDFGHKMGVFLKPWLISAGVEALVIGGNISNAFNLFGNSLQKYFNDHGIKTKIELSELKETASMIGGAVLIDNEFYERVKPLLPYM